MSEDKPFIKPPAAARWPHCQKHPSLANELADLLSKTYMKINGYHVNGSPVGLLLSDRYGLAEALLAAGWRPVNLLEDAIEQAWTDEEGSKVIEVSEIERALRYE